ncbi:MAG: 3',5'-cyclic-AMP phosphodiesterase [Elusimicrobiota bacterium]
MNSNIVRLIQLTDTHFFSDPSKKLCGVNTTDSLDAVISHAESQTFTPDFYLATGDLSQDETPESYSRLKNVFSSLGKQVYCLPGNHDEAKMMKNHLESDVIRLDKTIDLECWKIILLSSVIPKSNAGNLSNAELGLLKKELEKETQKNILITFHHNPIPMSSQWLDTMMVNNGDQFFQLIVPYENVKAVLWGHVHQQYDGEKNELKLMSTPSTCVQFLPRGKNFSVDTLAPGYRWLELHPDGKIKTGIERIKNFSFIPDLTTRGY